MIDPGTPAFWRGAVRTERRSAFISAPICISCPTRYAARSGKHSSRARIAIFCICRTGTVVADHAPGQQPVDGRGRSVHAHLLVERQSAPDQRSRVFRQEGRWLDSRRGPIQPGVLGAVRGCMRIASSQSGTSGLRPQKRAEPIIGTALNFVEITAIPDLGTHGETRTPKALATTTSR